MTDTPGFRQISEEEFARSEHLRKLAATMLNNQKSRQHILRAQKEAFPGVTIPEIDNQTAIQTALGDISKTVSDFIKAQKEDRAKEIKDRETEMATSRWESGRQSLRESGVMEEGLKKVEEFMSQTGIVDHKVGWAAFSKLYPEPTPVPTSSRNGINGFLEPRTDGGDDIVKQMLATGGDEAALNVIQDKLIDQALADMQSPNRPFGR